MKIVLFEDERVPDLYPLVFLRPVFDLRCGIFTLKEKVEKKFSGSKVYLETRDELDAVTAERYGADKVNSLQAVKPDDDLLLVNAAAILTGEAASYGACEKVGVTEDGRFVWAFLKRDTVQKMDTPASIGLAQKALEQLPKEKVGDILISYPWNLIHHNPEQIRSDFQQYCTAERKSEPHRGAAMMGPSENLYIGENVELQPHTWIDCRGGPVVLSDGVKVLAQTSIHGPCFIGKGTQIFEGRIREGCSIGPVCRVGGEVEESIIHAYSNKYHSGFLGHAYVCEWVNLGALTTNSDLKNDYSTVKLMVGGQQVDSGDLKVGSFIGDHTKTSIGTLLNTGSIIGIMCNLMAGASVLPKHIPSFCWYVQDRISKGLGMDYALTTARAAMDRRGVKLGQAMIDLIKHTEKITAADKLTYVRKDRKKIRHKAD
jgi:UDP-N-acetylglucosamine diphosphorylase/glucosamine-1-phosphate N-acetyltransferase